jgi:hypothetical protein
MTQYYCVCLLVGAEMGVLMIPSVGERGSNDPSGVLSTMIGVLIIPVEGERGSNS